MLPGVCLVGARAKPRPPDKRHNDPAFEQIVAAYHVDKGIKGPRMARKGVQKLNDRRVEWVHEYFRCLTAMKKGPNSLMSQHNI
jgi:hypothetical protein